MRSDLDYVGCAIGVVSPCRHYISDVLVGALLGAGTGLGLPVLLHYGRFGDFAAPADGGTALLVLPFATADSWGVMLGGKL